MYTHAVKRRERLSGAERREFDRAVEWAEWALMGTNGPESVPEQGEPQSVAARETSA